jgi:hypothetical protein
MSGSVAEALIPLIGIEVIAYESEIPTSKNTMANFVENFIIRDLNQSEGTDLKI